MKLDLLDWLCCPHCANDLKLECAVEAHSEIESGQLICTACAKEFPIVRCVPRFVSPENYASNFGLQWNQFRQTQLDSYSGTTISRDRFVKQTGWNAECFRDTTVLDAGCGAGRFAEIALSLGARVIAIDYSDAVDACWQNLGAHPHLNVIQADLYHLPFKPNRFDHVYSLGVLQHTPNVRDAFTALPKQLRPGGWLVVDLYVRNWRAFFHPRYWLRPFTTRLAPEKLFGLVARSASALLNFSRTIGRIPLAGRFLKRFIPVANYEGVYPLSEKQLLEWAILDTFDWLAPRYDQPQTPTTLDDWMQQAGLEHIQVLMAHHLTGRGRKPAQQILA